MRKYIIGFRNVGDLSQGKTEWFPVIYLSIYSQMATPHHRKRINTF